MPQGTGKIVVKKDGSLVSLCSMKCEKNMFRLGRNPRKQKWITSKKQTQELDMFEEKEKVVLRAAGKLRRK
jgi:large subunit ribosomal protein L24e